MEAVWLWHYNRHRYSDSDHTLDSEAQNGNANNPVFYNHLTLAKGILETCYSRDSDTDNLIPNPTLPILSDLAKTCKRK